MLTIYRRHSGDCAHRAKARRERRCKCPIWVQGSLRGEYVRKALNLNAWEAAADLVHGWQGSGQVGVVKPTVPTVREAVEKYLADAKARNLQPEYVKKLQQLLETKLLAFCTAHNCRLLKQLDVDRVRAFRESWTYAPIPAKKRL